MGLDMYLTRRVLFYKHGDEKAGLRDATLKPLSEALQQVGKPRVDANNIGKAAVENEVMYWRKANAIHGWFVRHVQNGEDECRPFTFDSGVLEKLLEDCKAIKDDPSKIDELMPPTSGFFFGSTEVDEGFWQDIDETISVLPDIIAEGEAIEALPPEDYGRCYVEYEYQSSW